MIAISEALLNGWCIVSPNSFVGIKTIAVSQGNFATVHWHVTGAHSFLWTVTSSSPKTMPFTAGLTAPAGVGTTTMNPIPKPGSNDHT